MTDIDTTPARTFDMLGVTVDRALRESSFAPGLSMALTDRDLVLSENSHGLADLAAARPVVASTLFEIGSISKGFTCALLLQARDEGLLDLDRPVTTYLPWFQVRSRFAPITIRHLMTHTAAIMSDLGSGADAAFDVWSLRDTDATAAPGSWFHYSNVGYKALGMVLQAVYQRPYQDILSERLLRPLGMTEAESAITHQTRRRLAVGYEPFYDDRPSRREDGLVPATWLETATADGSIAATARDMTAWLRLLMCGGIGPDGAQLIETRSVHEMLTPAIDAEERGHRTASA